MCNSQIPRTVKIVVSFLRTLVSQIINSVQNPDNLLKPTYEEKANHNSVAGADQFSAVLHYFLIGL